MFSPSKLRINTKLFKKLLDLRSCYELSKIRYSDDIPEILKFYSDTPASCQLDKYPKLTEDDYTRFITKKAMKREPADTRQIRGGECEEQSWRGHSIAALRRRASELSAAIPPYLQLNYDAHSPVY
ncbi:hypothetical protein RR46_00642 [Papilio xuthus]|uniref:OAR domain-containing protein n=1 Tax=Papilio xuthus TaxID=66420 RepID=A0A0N1PF00_PAPXU|nr:hypothetical protein RR46_00642 [Papilio xuthus]